MKTPVAALLLAMLANAGTTHAADSPAESIDARLAALETRITRLEDANQIERVQRTYGYFVDKGLWTPLSELFSEDATLEIGGRGVFTGKKRVLEYMHTAFGTDGIKEGRIQNHMQFQQITDIARDGLHGQARSRAFVMAGGWGLPLYENDYVKENGVWKISKLKGPFTMYTAWEGWHKSATPNTRPDSFMPPPDLPPSVVYLTYPSYYIIPFHYPHPVTGVPWKVMAGDAGAQQFAVPAVPR
jgi:SnoaL-like domain